MQDAANGQGSNSVHVRQFNERVILTALRRLGSASKADLARYANLTNNTAGVIVRELEAQRLVRAEGKRSGQRGQPATLLSLNAERRLFDRGQGRPALARYPPGRLFRPGDGAAPAGARLPAARGGGGTPA